MISKFISLFGEKHKKDHLEFTEDKTREFDDFDDFEEELLDIEDYIEDPGFTGKWRYQSKKDAN